MKHRKVLSGFPGIGKTTLFKQPGGLTISDSDSSQFSWQDPVNKIRHPEWPGNYMNHLAEIREQSDVVCVSTHQEVRDALVKKGIEFVLVYPGPNMKDEYIARYVARGNAPGFVELLKKNYEIWIAGLQAQQNCTHVVLKPGQYLSDVLPQVLQ